MKQPLRELVLSVKQLPMKIVLSDGRGRVERFELVAAGRKFGAFLRRSPQSRSDSQPQR